MKNFVRCTALKKSDQFFPAGNKNSVDPNQSLSTIMIFLKNTTDNPLPMRKNLNNPMRNVT